MARTILLVDDHSGFRRMARLLLQRGGFDVIGEAASASEAIASARALEPDLVLLDVLLPDGNGVDVAAALATMPRPPGVVLTSSYAVEELTARLGQTPVLGFVPKAELTLARLALLFD